MVLLKFNIIVTFFRKFIQKIINVCYYRNNLQKNKKRGREMKQKVIFTVVLIVSILYIFIGNRIVMKNNPFKEKVLNTEYTKAEVTRILERSEMPLDIQVSGEEQYQVKITFEAQLLSGEHKDELVIANQTKLTNVSGEPIEVKAGDKVYLLDHDPISIPLVSDDNGEYVYDSQVSNSTVNENKKEWELIDHVRTPKLVWLGILFVVLLIVFGKLKGVKTMLSLLFTILSIFVVFVPAVLGGKNIYVWTITTFTFITINTLLIVYGYSKKTLVTAIGCIGGVLVSGLLTVIMNGIMKMTGEINDAVYLQTWNIPIDLKALIFAGIQIGALGAIMDVAIDLASSLYEVANQNEKPDFKNIMKSGINIGRDIMGTMTNTLILAYIGSSLATVLALTTSETSLSFALNKEMVAVEILQALVGSIGILTTIPLTSFAAAALYKYKETHKKSY